MQNTFYHRYFISLAYNGKYFHGWQIQPNGNSVQATLENALSLLLKNTIQVTGAGRTDAGVHAKKMVAHFDTLHPIQAIPNLIGKLNSFLPKAIVIYHIWEVNSQAHARFDAIARKYEYHVTTCKNPFTHDFAVKIAADINFETMNMAAKMLFQYTDFTSFSKLHTDVKTNNCKIHQAEWIQTSNTDWVFVIEADRFLRNMVRAIVGTLFEVGKGKIDPSKFANIIEQKNRNLAGSSVPAHGLFLVDVRYPNEIENPQPLK